MGDDSDGALVRRCREGDRRAFAGLVTRYEKPVYNAALRMLHDREDARDVAQAVFLKVYEHLADYDPHYRFSSWIYRIALNESINALHRRVPREPIGEDEADDAPGPEDTCAREQVERGIEAALMLLTPEYRSVLVLKHMLGCSYHDMSEILELPEKTVKSRLFTARQQLKVVLLGRGMGSR
jgi:RNA polymerase sigma-70 factor (ECF subfamily)